MTEAVVAAREALPRLSIMNDKQNFENYVLIKKMTIGSKRNSRAFRWIARQNIAAESFNEALHYYINTIILNLDPAGAFQSSTLNV